ncbi:hypothetical protein BCR37DRAFT_393458, partial [Protomyces lactucae-debilis]
MFPKLLRDEAILEYDAPTKDLFFAPAQNHEMLKNFCAPWLLAWRAEMDVQPITSKFRLLLYLSKYASKGNKSNFDDLLTTVLDNTDDEARFTHLAKKLVFSQMAVAERPNQEVMHHLLGLPLIESSRLVVTVNCHPDQLVMLESDELVPAMWLAYEQRKQQHEALSMW